MDHNVTTLHFMTSLQRDVIGVKYQYPPADLCSNLVVSILFRMAIAGHEADLHTMIRIFASSTYFQRALTV